jgi:hypothetical protein
VWGLRKLCLTIAPDMIALLENNDAFIVILEFLKTSLQPYKEATATKSDAPLDQEEESQRKKNEHWVRN